MLSDCFRNDTPQQQSAERNMYKNVDQVLQLYSKFDNILDITISNKIQNSKFQLKTSKWHVE